MVSFLFTRVVITVLVFTFHVITFIRAGDGVAPVYSLGSPIMMGSGCPTGTVQTAVAEDGQSLSILFSSFVSNTSPSQTRVRNTCNLALPVTAMPGISIGFFQVDYRGYAYVPSGSAGFYATLANEYFFAGQSGAVMSKRYDSGFDGAIHESNVINFGSVIWSPCGGSTNFRVNSAVTAAKPNGTAEDVQIAVDSIDATVTGEVQVFVTYKPCKMKD